MATRTQQPTERSRSMERTIEERQCQIAKDIATARDAVETVIISLPKNEGKRKPYKKIVKLLANAHQRMVRAIERDDRITYTHP